MSNKPLVSIVSVTYNQEKYIRFALDSFLMQKTNFKYEIVISDDASSDGTPKIIKEYANKYPDIFKPIFRMKNIGVTENFIKTIELAEGKYIALCEGDDFWTDPNKLQKQADFMENHADNALCFHPVRVFFENREEEDSTWPIINDLSKLTAEELVIENFIPTNSVMYRRVSYKIMPLKIMPVDWYLHAFHAQHGKIGFLDEVMSSYRRHSQGVWWNSYGDTDKLWLRHGADHIGMHLELLKLYKNDEKITNITLASIARLINKMAQIDKQFQGHIIEEVLQKYPASTRIFVESLNLEVEIQKHLILENNIYSEKKEQEQNEQLMQLREQNHTIKDELHTLKNSRVFGKIIMLREYVGVIRNTIIKAKRIPQNAVHKVRVVVAPLFPPVIRKSIKKLYKKSKAVLVDYSGVNVMSVKAVDVERWQSEVPLVSVVVPYYNAAKTIDETLYSLKAQTFSDFEVIVVNDGSTDELSIEKFQSLEKNNPSVKFVSQKNQGPASARNTGVAQSKGKYVICLDSDDWFESTYIEKAILILETNPDVSLVSPYTETFGIKNNLIEYVPYDPLLLFSNNMLIHAAAYRKEAWSDAGGYKSDIGYEDWEFWITLAEKGYWGRVLQEPLFHYRVSTDSRYVSDKDAHWRNLKKIKSLHTNYKKIVKNLLSQRKKKKTVVVPETSLINVNNKKQYKALSNSKHNVLITIPWMTFGGAETLIYNYCREIKDKFNISFATGQKSEHEWEYKFREITPNIYHMASLFDDPKLHFEFISNYVKTRDIDVLHVIHNGFTFAMMPELKKRHPNLKIILTLFNDRVPEYVQGAIDCQSYIDSYVSDNSAVARSLGNVLTPGAAIKVIPNGIDAYEEFNIKLFDRANERALLDIGDEDKAVFFVGRLSEEKNPDVFVRAAMSIGKVKGCEHVKFFVVGDGPMRSEVEKMIHDNKISNIKYLGYQSEVAKYLSTADIFVLPSKIEGFPLSILEAMAMNVAVIASDVGAVAEVLDSENDGYVITPGSTEEIVSIIIRLTKDKDKLHDIQIKARAKVVAKYSNRILGKNYRELYDGMVK